jgi:pyridoxamine 5'-phosphate oxidase
MAAFFMNLENYRKDYNQGFLDEHTVLENPIEQFKKWFDEAEQFGIVEPNAMILSTSINDEVSSRTVLLKGIQEEGFVFYTNYESHKGQQLAYNPNCALTFLWLNMERQVKIEGSAKKLERSASESYFMSRPLESQLSAWASAQSKHIADRAELDKSYMKAEERFKNDPMYCPPNWGGFLIQPRMIEFWQGRQGRLHDRVQYSQASSGPTWKIQRLQP